VGVTHYSHESAGSSRQRLARVLALCELAEAAWIVTMNDADGLDHA
jgi:hypothetical protein